MMEIKFRGQRVDNMKIEFLPNSDEFKKIITKDLSSDEAKEMLDLYESRKVIIRFDEENEPRVFLKETLKLISNTCKTPPSNLGEIANEPNYNSNSYKKFVESTESELYNKCGICSKGLTYQELIQLITKGEKI